MVRLVDRDAADPVFEVAVTLSVMLPVPEDGATLAHEAPLDAVHEQFGPLAVRNTDAEPPNVAKGLAREEASTVTLQGVGS